MTDAQMRRLALALPGVEERSHFAKPDFRVKKKIFAGLSRDGKRGNLKLRLDTQEVVTSAKPEAFVPAEGAWGRAGWTYVVLEQTTVPELRHLLDEAYRLVAGIK
jgi:predicted DNA-binding protein (MmcQ/YjbR family)